MAASHEIESLFGPMLVGVILNCVLYGSLMVQTGIYFQAYKGDPLWFKVFVLYLFFCETLNTGCDVAVVYEPLVSRYGTLRELTIAPIMLTADPILTVMISTPVQLFTAWRVKIMSKSNVLFAIICFFAICSFVGGMATTISITIFREYVYFRESGGAAITWLVASTAANITITGSLVYNLLLERTGYPSTHHIVNTIICLGVQTGFVTSVSSLVDVIIPAVLGKTTLNFIWDFALSKLYTVSLLATLNARGGWRPNSGPTRDNVLFGYASRESTPRNRTQIEMVTADRTNRRASSVVPVMVFDSNVAYRHGRGSPADRHDPKIVDTKV